MRLLPLLVLALVVPSLRAAEVPAGRFAAAAATSREAHGVAMIVMIDGAVVFEDYPNGGAAGTAWELASGTKSFAGLLAVCAEEDGLLALDEKASVTLSEWRTDPARRDITIRQLLTLTSGIPGGETVLRGGRVPTYAEAIGTKPLAKPGDRFSYGPAPFQVFGEILRRKLQPRNETVMQYLKRRVLDPVGLNPGHWRMQVDGQPNLPSGASLCAREWARFGEVIRLDAKGLLPPGKVAACFRGTTANPGYGLGWWLPGQAPFGAVTKRSIHGPAIPADIWMAGGAGGQRLVVIPSLKLVAVRLAPVMAERSGAFNDAKWLRELIAGATGGKKAD